MDLTGTHPAKGPFYKGFAFLAPGHTAKSSFAANAMYICGLGRNPIASRHSSSLPL